MPSRADTRIADALIVAAHYRNGEDPRWVIDRMVRELTGRAGYLQWLRHFETDTNTDTPTWDPGKET